MSIASAADNLSRMAKIWNDSLPTAAELFESIKRNMNPANSNYKGEIMTMTIKIYQGDASKLWYWHIEDEFDGVLLRSDGGFVDRDKCVTNLRQCKQAFSYCELPD